MSECAGGVSYIYRDRLVASGALRYKRTAVSGVLARVLAACRMLHIVLYQLAAGGSSATCRKMQQRGLTHR
jgi:hypothetical protein